MLTIELRLGYILECISEVAVLVSVCSTPIFPGFLFLGKSMSVDNMLVGIIDERR